MNKTTKVIDISDTINLVCIRDNTTNCNPYSLYLVYPSHDRYGYPAMHRKRIAKYQDITSILCHIRDMFISGVQRKPVPDILSWNRQYYGS